MINLNTVDLQLFEEKKTIDRILTDLKIGWWKVDHEKKGYVLSDIAVKMLKLDSNIIRFKTFTEMIREDYRARIMKEIENIENQYLYDQTFPIQTPSGEIWLRSKIIHKETDEKGNSSISGFIQIIPNPEVTQPEKASLLRINNLLYQLNTISHTLLSFLQSDTADTVINKILENILEQFKGGRAYIIEYNWEKKTQTCTYEVTDSNVNKEQSRINDMPMEESPWWTLQITRQKHIILSDLNELPEEAYIEKEFLALQEIKSIIVAPLISHEGVWGYVGIDVVEEHHEWSNEDCQWFTSLANIINICIGLQRSEHEAQIDRTYLQNLYKHMPLGYTRLKLLYDSNRQPIDYLFVDANYAAGEINGYNVEKYIGHKASELRVNLKEELVYLQDILHTKKHADVNYYIEPLKKHCHAIIYSTVEDEVICLISDITESYNTHEALDRSEKILRNIYDNLPAGIELYDKTGKLVDMNIKDLEIFGLKRKEDALGVSIFENPNIPAEIIEKIRKEEPVSFRLNYSFKSIEHYYSSTKKGNIEIYTTVSALYDKQGNLIHYLFINIDNTEISNAYSKIAEFESSFSAISKFGKIGYCKFDLFTKNGYGVAQWYRNLGEHETTPLPQIIGVYNHVHEEDKAYILDSIRKVKAHETDNFSRDLRVHTEEGWKWTRINVMRNTMNNDTGKLEMLCVNYDITELKETEKKLIEAKNRAEISDRLKSAFLANMSHEIRTPLNAIVGFSNLLTETDDRDERAAYFDIVQENNELLLQLISDILDLSKIEAGTLDITNSDVNVNQLCEEIIRSFSLKAEENNIEILFEQHLPACHINSDKNRLTQIITNFINNALKFTSKGSITLGYYQSGPEEIKFYVKDTGTGIPKDKINNVFERFIKLNSFAQGTGLGLSICKSLAEQMGGEIGVESQEGKGSCFWFTHPFHPDVQLKLSFETTEIKAIEPAHLFPNPSQPTILVAEDTDSNFLLVSAILKKDYRLFRAVDGVEAVKLAAEIHPDLILMDIKMPHMDGIEATKEIRKTDKNVPIVAVTAFAFDSDRQRVLDAGCNDYMSKPITGPELHQKLREMIRLRFKKTP
ncbi:hypothetical protein IE90_06645 [Sanguibacteroides justesenii]|uniref:histidine kinase n=1 Tax=Sanguibacteroides justesenii TaxID=1547597 RepID=A0AB34R8K4_9PORP|nr:hypothetical protein IE90_06645 [Sanguibacteroides justesenii]